MTERLLLLPGMDGTGRLFEPLIAALGDDVEAEVVHYPTDLPLAYKALGQLVGARLPGSERAFVLGESFSGPIAISLAASHPHQIAGVILSCTFASSPMGSLGRFVSALGPFMSILSSSAAARYLLLGADPPRAVEAGLRRALNVPSARVLRERLRSVASVDVRAELRSSKVPVLYLQAAQDRVVPHRAFDEIRRLRPDAELQRIEGPHCLLQVCPVPSAAAITRFMDRYGRKASSPP